MREGPQQLLPLHRRAIEAGAGQQTSERIRDLRRQETVDSRIALILSGQVLRGTGFSSTLATRTSSSRCARTRLPPPRGPAARAAG